MGTITGANAVYTISVPSLFDAPENLHQFMADDSFSTEQQDVGETVMSNDGYLTGGFVFAAVSQTVSLLADSESIDLFDTWSQSMRTQRDAYFANGVITLPSVGKKWTMTRGLLVKYAIIPDVKKLLQGRKMVINWQSAIPSSL